MSLRLGGRRKKGRQRHKTSYIAPPKQFCSIWFVRKDDDGWGWKDHSTEMSQQRKQSGLYWIIKAFLSCSHDGQGAIVWPTLSSDRSSLPLGTVRKKRRRWWQLFFSSTISHTHTPAGETFAEIFHNLTHVIGVNEGPGITWLFF